MSETLTFSGGDFTLPTELPPGATPYEVTTVSNPDFGTVYEISNSDPNSNSIKKLEIGGITDGTPILIPDPVKALTVDFGASDDTLILTANSKKGELDFGGGNDNFEAIDNTKKSEIGLGEGNDTVVFGGKVKGIDLSLGDGEDLVIFQSEVKNSRINLGDEDGDLDTIRFEGGEGSYTNVVITGADDGDVLFIGTTQYNYDSSEFGWVNDTNPNDTRFFL